MLRPSKHERWVINYAYRTIHIAKASTRMLRVPQHDNLLMIPVHIQKTLFS